MPNNYQHYSGARERLISFLTSLGYEAHPDEVYCPTTEHCWVDVAARRGQDYWAFEYKSRRDSIRRGLEQCRSYAKAFNYVVLVADRRRVTSSPYFGDFKRFGFGVWRHDGETFYRIFEPKRQSIATRSKRVVERQFRPRSVRDDNSCMPLPLWFQEPLVSSSSKGLTLQASGAVADAQVRHELSQAVDRDLRIYETRGTCQPSIEVHRPNS